MQQDRDSADRAVDGTLTECGHHLAQWHCDAGGTELTHLGALERGPVDSNFLAAESASRISGLWPHSLRPRAERSDADHPLWLYEVENDFLDLGIMNGRRDVSLVAEQHWRAEYAVARLQADVEIDRPD